MSSTEKESFDSTNKKQTSAQSIAKILRQDYKNSGSAVKWIARKSNLSEHAVKNWYNAVRVPSLDNFIKLTKASPALINWLLIQVDREDLANIIDAHSAFKNQSKADTFDLYRLIFETQGSGYLLKKVQKLTMRQLWFYSQIKKGHKINHHDMTNVFGIARATAYRDISELCQLSLICKVGRGKDEYYTAL
jgi:hypothetical protein